MVTWPEGSILLLLAPAWPLLLGLLAAHPALRAVAMRLLPLAPLPALVLALAGTAGERLHAGDLLLGVTLELDAPGRLLLGMTAFLWLVAGLAAPSLMGQSRHPAIFTGFWCLTLSGNLGVCLAADMPTFYVAFAAVSLAAYFLVVHDGSEAALRAGRVYIVLAVLGEACLLLGFLVGAAAAGSLLIADIRLGLPASALYLPAVLLLVAGFGLKAGLVPLHVWLPLAHSAAPTPASAVLSGAIVKVGIIGLMRFLPDGAVGLGEALLVLGLAGAILGALAGLCQHSPKTVLAYSTVSQMSLLVAVFGAALSATGSGGMKALVFYALHHGLAKAALFLAVGVIALTGRRWLPPILAVTALLALSVAGLPLTGGALAKAAIKPVFDGPALIVATASAATTALVLLRFLFLTAPRHAREQGAVPGSLLLLPWLALAAAALLLPWLLLPDWSGLDRLTPLQPAVLLEGGWPIGLAVVIAFLSLRLGLKPPALPPGDILVPLERMAAALVARARRGGGPREQGAATASRGISERLVVPVARAEALLSRWPVAGLAVLLLVLLVAVSVARWPV